MSRISFPVSSAAPVSTAVAASAGSMVILPQVKDASGPSFTPCAGGFSAGDAWAQLYRLAYQQARAALEPSRFQKAFAPCWN